MDTSHLTSRENQVFKLLVEGNSNKEIAKSLNLSVRTAEKYISTMLGKFGNPNRTKFIVEYWKGVRKNMR